jgi:hypothetical protein
MSADHGFSTTRDPHRPIVTFASSVQLSTACLPIVGELFAALIDTKPKTFDNAVHITSADDGIHSATSFHYVGRGFDVRILGMRHGGIVVESMTGPLADEEAQRIYAERQHVIAGFWALRLTQQLKGRWQVMVEDDHLHCEKDPS